MKYLLKNANVFQNSEISRKDVRDASGKKLSRKEKIALIDRLTKEMKDAAKNLDFERACELRDILFELKSE